MPLFFVLLEVSSHINNVISIPIVFRICESEYSLQP